jgi:hypothetical protein
VAPSDPLEDLGASWSLERPPRLREQVRGQRHARERGTSLELSVNIVREVADLDHLDMGSIRRATGYR